MRDAEFDLMEGNLRLSLRMDHRPQAECGPLRRAHIRLSHQLVSVLEGPAS